MSGVGPSASATMRAVRIPIHGDVSVLEWAEIPRPSPAPGEVLVEIRAAGMNHLDLWARRGVPGYTFPLPLTPGCDGAGRVVELGAGEHSVAVGDEVILAPGLSCGRCEACLAGRDNLCREYGILGETRDGTCARFVAVPTANALRRPPGIDDAHAACFALAALTADTMLVERARITPGEDVLVIAGGSGVGSMAIQIAKLYGCRVIATAGGAEKCRRLRDLGADETIDHSAEDVAGRTRELTHRKGVDVVVEHVGKATWKDSLRALAWGGRLVTCGATTGYDVECDLRPIFFRSQSILGSTMGSKGDLFPLLRFLQEGKVLPVVDRVLPMSRAAEAHRLLEDRKVFGKIVLVPAEDR